MCDSKCDLETVRGFSLASKADSFRTTASRLPRVRRAAYAAVGRGRAPGRAAPMPPPEESTRTAMQRSGAPRTFFTVAGDGR